MGLIISRFRRKKTTIEILEGIEKEINSLQKNRKENQDSQKRVATGLIIYSIILYIISAVIFFLLYFPDTWPLRLLYSLPLLAFPFLIWGIKRLLHWYFIKRIARNDLALRDLREKKKQILEDVMETETYKKAKEILEKFDPAKFKKLEKDEQSGSTSPTSPATGTSGTALHLRKPVVAQTPSQPSIPRPRMTATPVPRPYIPTPNPFGNTPLRPPVPLASSALGDKTPIQRQVMTSVQAMPQQAMPPQMSRGYGPPGPPMPRSVLPRDRGTMDKLMDYLVGDGPENRYALICRACHSHNGMALKEEFEYMSFRCCYCFIMNPARKQRPLAPRLEFFTPSKKITLTQPEDTEDDESDEEEEEEEEKEEEKNNDNNEKTDDLKRAKMIPTVSSSTSSSSSSATTVISNLASKKRSNISAVGSKLPVVGARNVPQVVRDSTSVREVKEASDTKARNSNCNNLSYNDKSSAVEVKKIASDVSSSNAQEGSQTLRVSKGDICVVDNKEVGQLDMSDDPLEMDEYEVVAAASEPSQG